MGELGYFPRGLSKQTPAPSHQDHTGKDYESSSLVENLCLILSFVRLRKHQHGVIVLEWSLIMSGESVWMLSSQMDGQC